MSYQDSVKPFVATVLLALYLPVPFYLLLTHGLHDVWRRMGPRSFRVHVVVWIVLVAVVVRLHPLWRWQALSWPDVLGLAALVPLGLAAWLALLTYTQIDRHTLHQIKQFDAGADRELITSGILGRIRHPRYVMFLLLALGNAMITGYPLVITSFVVCAVLFAIVVRVEERELIGYFGDAYREYMERTPAFVPRPRGGRRAGA